MRSETVTTVLEAPQSDVFGYLSRIENLPDWANEFARELEWRDGEAVVVNGLGTEKDNEKAIREVAQHGTQVAFDPANMLRHNQIADMIAITRPEYGTSPARHS